MRKIPLEDFFRNPARAAYRISPAGSRLAFLKPHQNRLNLFVSDADGGSERRITSETERDISDYCFKGESRLVYLRDFGGDENYHLLCAGVDTGEVVDMTPYPDVKVDVVDSLPSRPGEIIVAMNHRDKEAFDAYRLDLLTGKSEMVAENPGPVTSWITDHDGRVLVGLATDGVDTRIFHRPSEAEPFSMILSTNFRNHVEPLFFTHDNRNLIALTNIGRDKIALCELDVSTGEEVRCLFERPDVDCQGASFSRRTKRPVSAAYATWRREYSFFDADRERIYKDVAGRLEGCDIHFVSWTLEEDKAVVWAHSDRSLGSNYIYDAGTGDLRELCELSPWLRSEELCAMEPFSYDSRDGLRIHGYLTCPEPRPAGRMPLVVAVHGGPWARVTWGFQGEVQFLANRGYAVFQPNFRGSTGYGRAFWEASFKEWGRAVQNDIADGVYRLIDEGIADPRRIAIYGGSFGGYAVLSGLTMTPDLYACGVDYVGVSNLFTFLDSIPPYWEPYRETLYEMIGHPERDHALLEEASPLFHADRIRVPLMVAQGARDPRVKMRESDQMVEALRRRGVDVEYLVRENEGHGFRNEENRFDFYGAMEAFLEKHIGRP